MKVFLIGLLAMLALIASSLAGASPASAGITGYPKGGGFTPTEGTTLTPGASVNAQGFYMDCRDSSGAHQSYAIDTQLHLSSWISGSVGAWSNSLNYGSEGIVSPWTVPADAAGKYLIFRITFKAGSGRQCSAETAVWFMAFYVGSPSPPAVTARALSATAGSAITSFSMSVTNSPTSYSASGLPSGLSINSSSGAISGTPTRAGSFTSTITATNAGGSGSGTLTSSIAYGTQPALTVSTTSGSFGRDLALATSGGAGTGSVTYTLAGAGSAGCSLLGTSLRFTSIGSCVLTATKAGDDAYSSRSSSATTITVGKGTPTISWSSPSPITFPTELSASQLNAVALLDGVPVSGTFSYSPSTGVSLTPGNQTLSVSFTPVDTVNVNSVPVTTISLTVSPGTALTPQLGSPVTELGGFRISVENYDSNFIWGISATSGSASFDASTREIRVTGLSRGTSSSVTLTTTRTNYSSGSSTSSGTSLAIPTITSASTAVGEVGSNFTGYVVAATSSPTSFTASGLPAPLAIDPATGSITGIPTAAGTYTVTVGATNAAGTGSRTFTLTVNRGAQSAIVLTTTDGTFGIPLGLSAAGGNGAGLVSYSVSDPGSAVCAISGSSLTSSQAGTCTVQISRAGDSDYLNVSSLALVNIGRSPQSALAITSVTEKSFDSSLLLIASGGDGGGTITFAVTDLGEARCSISGNILSSSGDVGSSCGITATRSQSTNYLAQVSAQVRITVATKAVQPTLTVTAPTLAYRTPVMLSSSGGAGTGGVSFTVTTAGTAGCSVTSGELRSTGDVGSTCGVTATKATSTNYLVASSVELTVTITGKAAQVIDFSAPADRVFSTTSFAVAPTAASGLAVVMTTSTPTICTVSGFGITMLLPGVCTLAADQSGNENFSPAATVTRSFAISRVAQLVSWSPIVGVLSTASPLTMNTASGAGSGTITYSVLDRGTTGCTILNSALAVLTFTAPGSCALQAEAGETATYLAGTSTKIFVISAPVQSGAGSGGGDSSAVSATSASTAALSVITVRTLNPILAHAGLAPGYVRMVVEDDKIPVRVEANATNTGLDVIGMDWRIKISAVGANGSPIALAPGGVLSVVAGTQLRVIGSGFEGLAQVRTYLLARTLLLGSLMTDSSGDFDGMPRIPTDVAFGVETLQINGFTRDRMVRSLSLGIYVKAPLAVSGAVGSRIYFPYKSATLSVKAKKSLVAMIAQLLNGTGVTATVQGAVRSVGETAADRTLAWNRSSAVQAFLEARGFKGHVTTSLRRVTAGNVYRDRRVDITIRPVT